MMLPAFVGGVWVVVLVCWIVFDCRYGCLFMSLRGGYEWFTLLSFVMYLLQCVIAGVASKMSNCAIGLWILTALACLHFGATAVCRCGFELCCVFRHIIITSQSQALQLCDLQCVVTIV